MNSKEQQCKAGPLPCALSSHSAWADASRGLGAKLGRVKMWVGGFGGLREWRTIHIMRTSELT